MTDPLLEKEIDKLPEEYYPELKEYVRFLLFKASDRENTVSSGEKRLIGGFTGSLKYMSEDFDEPIDDFKEYM